MTGLMNSPWFAGVNKGMRRFSRGIELFVLAAGLGGLAAPALGAGPKVELSTAWSADGVAVSYTHLTLPTTERV